MVVDVTGCLLPFAFCTQDSFMPNNQVFRYYHLRIIKIRLTYSQIYSCQDALLNLFLHNESPKSRIDLDTGPKVGLGLTLDFFLSLGFKSQSRTLKPLIFSKLGLSSKILRIYGQTWKTPELLLNISKISYWDIPILTYIFVYNSLFFSFFPLFFHSENVFTCTKVLNII